jgi:hypothetical protein
MADIELTFDHLALMRAHWAIGRECENIVDKMVAPLTVVFEQSGLGLDQPYHQKGLLRPVQRSVVYSHFRSAKNVLLFAGILEGVVRVWCDTSPKFEHKDKLRTKYQTLLPELKRNGRQWLMSLNRWNDLCIQKPMVDLLSESDQAKAIHDFVAGALTDLQAVEIDRVIREACNGSPT